MEINDLCIKCGHQCCKWIGWSTSEMSGRSLEYYLSRGAKVLACENGKRIYRVYLQQICPHLEEGKGCKIYDRRPLACIEYEGNLDPLMEGVCLIK